MVGIDVQWSTGGLHSPGWMPRIGLVRGAMWKVGVELVCCLIAFRWDLLLVVLWVDNDDQNNDYGSHFCLHCMTGKNDGQNDG